MSKYKEIDSYRQFTGPAETQKAINSFRGILEGIAIDGQVDKLEQTELSNWYTLYRNQIDRHPFNEILPVIDIALSDGILTTEEVQDLLWLCEQVSSGEYYDLITSAIQTLHGIIHGILANNKLTDVEIRRLASWMDDHSILKGTYPFDEIYSLVDSVLEDDLITEYERNTLIAFFSEFIDMRDSLNLNEIELAELKDRYCTQGVCAKNPDIQFAGHIFCFTGTSIKATRDEIANIVTAKGGIFTNSVGKKTEYLVVGLGGNPCWAFSCYGRKVEKAIALRKSGAHIAIVSESDFWDSFTKQEE